MATGTGSISVPTTQLGVVSCSVVCQTAACKSPTITISVTVVTPPLPPHTTALVVVIGNQVVESHVGFFLDTILEQEYPIVLGHLAHKRLYDLPKVWGTLINLSQLSGKGIMAEFAFQ